MWEFLQKNSFIIGALTGSVAAFLLGLLVDYLRRERKILGYSVISRKIVEKGHKEIEIRYRNKPIESLYSHKIIIRNAGNRALKNLPIQITCDGGSFVENELTIPMGANFLLTKEKDKNTVLVFCDLLNKGEVFSVGLTSMDSLSDKILVVAREENLVCKEITQEAKFPELVEIIGNQFITSRILVNILKALVKF